MFDVVEQLKKDWTDKYVVVSSPAPELARFANATGTVKTVNMNGRCLVEFDQYNNIGWYDIDPAFLKIVPKPLPKPPEAKPTKNTEAKPSKQTEAKPSKQAEAKPTTSAVAKPAAGKPSTADILAAARAKSGGAAPAAAKPAAGAARPSTADILAMARAKKAAAESAPPPAAEAPAESAGEAVAEAPAPKAAAPKKAAGGSLPTTTAEKIAWCREHDAKS